MDDEVLDGKMGDIEKQKLDIEKKRLALEESFSKKFAVPVVSAIIAGLFALAQVWVASINKDKELELNNRQSERTWKLEMAEFVFKNRDVIFSNNLKEQEEQRRLRDVILVTFPPEVTARLFERIEVAVPNEQKMVWQEAQELVSKVAAVEAAQTEALSLFRQGKFEESVSANNKVLEIDPNNVQILNRKGYSLFRSKKFDEAISTLSQAVQHQPDHGLANLNLAKALCAAGKPADAKNTLKVAIKLKPALLQTALSDGEFCRTCKQILPDLKLQEAQKSQ